MDFSRERQLVLGVLGGWNMSNEKFVVKMGFRVLPSYVGDYVIKPWNKDPVINQPQRFFRLLLEALLRLSDVQEISEVYVAGMRSVGKPWSRDGKKNTSTPFEVEFKLVRFPENADETKIAGWPSQLGICWAKKIGGYDHFSLILYFRWPEL